MRKYDVEYKGNNHTIIADDAMEAFEIFTHFKPFGNQLIHEYNLLGMDRETSGRKWALYAASIGGKWKRVKVKLISME